MISSLNGEAEGWGREVKLLKSRYRGLDDLIMLIGGNLVVGSGDNDEIGGDGLGSGPPAIEPPDTPF